MPDALRHVAEKSIAAKACSYEDLMGVFRGLEHQIRTPHRLFVGEAFMPDAFRHVAAKSIAAEACSYENLCATASL